MFRRIARPFVCVAIGCLPVLAGCSPADRPVTEGAAAEHVRSADDVAKTPTDSADSEATGSKVSEDSEPADAFYTVSHYDKARDPDVDLAEAIRRADTDGKRIVLQVGGDWCGWCARISDYMETNQRVHDLLVKNFVVMKVTYPGDHAETFLSKYPKCDAYPHFFVLEKDGTFLHSQGTSELEKGDSYDEGVFANFLSAWVP